MSEHTQHPLALNHGPIDEVFEGIWYVRGAMKMPMKLPMRISRAMTIIKNPNNDELTLINTVRLTEDGLAELDKLGKVTNIIRIAGFHGRDDGFYRDRYDAKIYAIKGQVYTRKLENNVEQEGYLQPDVWLDANSTLPIENAKLKIIESSSPTEGIIRLDTNGGILVTGDSLQNTGAPDQYVNLPAKLLMKMMGFYKPYNVGPGWIKFGTPNTDEIKSILDLDFEHVLPGHGLPVIDDAKEKFRLGIESL
jgi:glyoxylase-like metal-dependent hydrolase (beta-lactamase superfamily II)